MKKKRGYTRKWVLHAAGILTVLWIAWTIFMDYFYLVVDRDSIDTLNGEITIIGHGGNGFASLVNPINMQPANSWLSIQTALKNEGCTGVEVDLQLTSDSVWVLYHDQQLQSATDLTGCILYKSATEVVGQPYTLGFPYDWFQDEAILSFEELIEKLRGRATFPDLHLDLHTYDYCSDNNPNEQALAKSLVQAFAELDVPTQKVFITSTHLPLLIALRAEAPSIKLYLEGVEDPKQALELIQENDFQGWVIKARALTAEASALFHDEGLQIIAFGAKSKLGIFNAIQLNPDILLVDNIPAACDLLGTE